MQQTPLQQAALAPAPRRERQAAQSISKAAQRGALKRSRPSESSGIGKAVPVTEADSILQQTGAARHQVSAPERSRLNASSGTSEVVSVTQARRPPEAVRGWKAPRVKTLSTLLSTSNGSTSADARK